MPSGPTTVLHPWRQIIPSRLFAFVFFLTLSSTLYSPLFIVGSNNPPPKLSALLLVAAVFFSSSFFKIFLSYRSFTTPLCPSAATFLLRVLETLPRLFPLQHEITRSSSPFFPFSLERFVPTLVRPPGSHPRYLSPATPQLLFWVGFCHPGYDFFFFFLFLYLVKFYCSLPTPTLLYPLGRPRPFWESWCLRAAQDPCPPTRFFLLLMHQGPPPLRRFVPLFRTELVNRLRFLFWILSRRCLFGMCLARFSRLRTPPPSPQFLDFSDCLSCPPRAPCGDREGNLFPPSLVCSHPAVMVFHTDS